MGVEEMTVRRQRALSGHRGEQVDVRLVPLTFYAVKYSSAL